MQERGEAAKGRGPEGRGRAVVVPPHSRGNIRR